MKRKNKISINNYVLLGLLVAAIGFTMVGNVIAKYTYRQSEEAAVIAHEFYFESDYLLEGGKEYYISDMNETLPVMLMNHPDEKRYSTDDIKYTVTIEEDGGSTQTETGTLTKDAKSSATIDIPIEPGKTYTVTATGTAGYSKTLSATFKVYDNQGVYKSVEEKDGCVLLTVWVKDAKGNVTIKFPTGLVPDNTDDSMANVKITDGQLTDSANFAEEFSSHVYRFFKTDTTKSYNVNDFTVTVGSETATLKVPEV